MAETLMFINREIEKDKKREYCRSRYAKQKAALKKSKSSKDHDVAPLAKGPNPYDDGNSGGGSPKRGSPKRACPASIGMAQHAC